MKGRAMIAAPHLAVAGVRRRRSAWTRFLLLVATALSPICALAVTPSVTPAQWTALEGTHWIADGKDSAPRVVYLFTDPNCPFCNKLWSDARPWVASGKVQIRHVVVGILTPTSNGKAATLLNASDPARALADYEQGQSFSTARMIASGKVHALDAGVLQPLASIPPKIQETLDANKSLMLSLGLEATPAVVWKDGDGRLQVMQGVAPGDESRVFGPR